MIKMFTKIKIDLLKFVIGLIIGISILCGYTLNPTNETDRQVDAYFFEAIEYAQNTDYFKALELTRKISELVPYHPAGYLFSSAVLGWIISDFYNYDYVEEFLDEIEKTIDRAEDMIQEKRLNPWGYVYLGGAYGFRGIYYSTTGSFYYAFVDGVLGNYQLNKAITLDPQIYDSYFGTGTFDFWKAYYAGKFFWLGTADRNKQKGIDKINLAIAQGKYTTLEAEFSLIRIYLVDERYQDAIDKAEELLKNSPYSIKGRRFMGLAYRGLGQHKKALDTFILLREIIEKNSFKTPAVLLAVNMNIAKSYRDMNRYKEALTLLENTRKYYDQMDPQNDFLEDLLDEYKLLIEEVRNEVQLNN